MTRTTRLARLLLIPLLALVGVPALVVGTPSPAAACDCAQVDPAEVPPWTGPAFTAVVVEDPPRGATEVALAAVVTHVYQGSVPDEVVIEASTEGTACGLPGLGAGDALYVAQDLDGDVVHAGSCGGTFGASEEVLAGARRDFGAGRSVDLAPGALDPRGRGGGDAGGLGDQQLVGLGLFVGLVVVVGGGVAVLKRSVSRTAR